MKMFSKEEVVERIKLFNDYMAQEKELQQELLEISMSGSRDASAKALKRHDEIIAQIEKIRMEKMIPILDELSAFVAHCQKLEAEEKAAGGKQA